MFYTVSGFVEKNRDRLYPDMEAVLHSSKSDFVRALFDAEGSFLIILCFFVVVIVKNFDQQTQQMRVAVAAAAAIQLKKPLDF